MPTKHRESTLFGPRPTLHCLTKDSITLFAFKIQSRYIAHSKCERAEGFHEMKEKVY